MATEVLWWIFAVAIVAVSIGVVTARTVIHSAIFLILSLCGVGAMYILFWNASTPTTESIGTEVRVTLVVPSRSNC